MLLQLIAVLATSPLHDGSGDGSSSEDTPSFPAFRLLVLLSLRSRLAIWHFLCCALRAARLFSSVAWFWLKITSSGRGALAGTRWEHFNYDDKNTPRSTPRRPAPQQRANQTCREDGQLTNFSVLALGSIGSICDGGHE
jgi:hypothetical protein